MYYSNMIKICNELSQETDKDIDIISGGVAVIGNTTSN